MSHAFAMIVRCDVKNRLTGGCSARRRDLQIARIAEAMRSCVQPRTRHAGAATELVPWPRTQPVPFSLAETHAGNGDFAEQMRASRGAIGISPKLRPKLRVAEGRTEVGDGLPHAVVQERAAARDSTVQ